MAVAGRRGGLAHRALVRGAAAALVAAAAVAAVAGSSSSPPSARARAARSPGELVVSFLDIGQGDATLLQHGGASILFDTGPPGGPILQPPETRPA